MKTTAVDKVLSYYYYRLNFEGGEKTYVGLIELVEAHLEKERKEKAKNDLKFYRSFKSCRYHYT